MIGLIFNMASPAHFVTF